MSYKNKIIEIKNKYLQKNSLTTKFSLYYGIILIVILGIALSMGVIGVLFYLKLGINDVEEFVEILTKTSMVAFGVGAFLIIIISPILSKKILEPLDKITKAEQEISVEKLDKRINYTGKDIELKVLSVSFDKMIERLEISFNKQNQFISDVSHELKTPIALIQGYAEGLAENVTTDEESRKFYVEVIQDEANKMDKLVKQLLELMKLEYGKREFNNTKFDITELIGEVLRKTTVMRENQNIEVKYNPTEPIYVYADDFFIEQVVTNYITNAIKHVDEVNGNKYIEVRVEKQDKKVRINVYNTGEKISEEDLNRIWKRFYKIDSSRNREKGGSGIGLSLVKAIMNNYNNNFGAYNKDDGVEFFFELDTYPEDGE